MRHTGVIYLTVETRNLMNPLTLMSQPFEIWQKRAIFATVLKTVCLEQNCPGYTEPTHPQAIAAGLKIDS